MNVVDVIQFEGDPKSLVWKSPIEDFNTATQLIVDETHEAILMIEGRTEVLGPGRHTLETQNYFGLNAIQRFATGGKTAFPCKVYFVNKVHAMDLLWGTRDTLPVMDPELDIMLHLRLRGNLSFVVENSKKFVQKFVGFVSVFDDAQVVERFRGIIATEVTDQVAKVVVNAKIGLFSINAHLKDISGMLMAPLQTLFDEYGAKLVKFNLETITSNNEDTAEFQQAKAAAKARVIAAGSEAEARRLQGYTWSEEQQAAVMRTLAGNNGTAGSFIGGMLGIGTAGSLTESMNNVAGGFFGNGAQRVTGAGGGFAASVQGAPLGDVSAAQPSSDTQSAPSVSASVTPGGTSAPTAEPAPAAESVPAPVPGPASAPATQSRDQCPNCHGAVQSAWKICPFCGTPLGDSKCPNCHEDVQPSWMVCPFCGTKLK